MSIAALKKTNRGKYVHSPSHDLESLLQTALGVITFTDGPCASFRSHKDHVPISRWYNEIDREQLCKDKTIDIITYETEIEGCFPEYWQPLAPYLRRLVEATWPGKNSLVSSQATHSNFKIILEEALVHLKTLGEVPAKYACISQKRARPADDEEGRYPYKFHRGDGIDSKRLPRPAEIKALSQWKDSIDG